MLPSDKPDTTLFAEPSASATRPSKSARRPQNPERLAVELDFCRVSHASTTSAHPHVLFSPLHYERGYAYPLLVWLHGAGGDERQVMRIMPMLSMRNYVAIAPQGQGRIIREDKGDTSDSASRSEQGRQSLDVASILHGEIRPKITYDWRDTDEGLTEAEQRIFECMSLAKQRNNIAPQRIFLAGFGTGGTMALRLALLYPDCFAGVISLGGAFPSGRNVLHRWAATRNLAMFLGVGQTSTTFTPDDVCDSLRLFHTAGVPVTIREYPCGQELTPAMFQDLNRWMMEIVCA